MSGKRTLDIKDVIDWLEELATDLHGEGDTYGAHIIRSSFPDLEEEFSSVSIMASIDLASALGLNKDLIQQTKELNSLLTEVRNKSDFMAQDGVGLMASQFAHEMTRNKIDHYRGVSNEQE